MTTVDDVVLHAGRDELPWVDGSGGVWRTSISDGPGTLAAHEALAVDQGFDRPTGGVVG